MGHENPTGGWICELYPNGAKGKRIRKKFATKGEALAHGGLRPRDREKARSRNSKLHTPTRKAEKTAPSQSVKSSLSLYLMIKKPVV